MDPAPPEPTRLIPYAGQLLRVLGECHGLAFCELTVPPPFQGGPGATGRSYSSFDTIFESIRTTLLTLPGDTTVRIGHGDYTTIGAELPHLEEWIARGH